MANGIVIGGGNTNVGEVYANQIAQARAQANQQRAAEQQMMIERMRMAQAQRNADTENQYRYAALNQAASEKAADREFQRQEAMAGRGFSREENQAQREFAGGQTEKQIGASKESQQSSQEFSREQAKLARDQQAQLQREHMDLQKEQMALQEKLQDKSLSQAERMEGSRRLQELFRYGEELKFRKDQAKQQAAEHEQRLALGQQTLQMNKTHMQNQDEDRDLDRAMKMQSSTPDAQRRAFYSKTLPTVQKQVADQQKQSGKMYTPEETQAAIQRGMDWHMGQNFGLDKANAIATARAGTSGDWKTLAAAAPVGYEDAETKKMADFYVGKMRDIRDKAKHPISSFGTFLGDIGGLAPFATQAQLETYGPDTDAQLQGMGIHPNDIMRMKDAVNKHYLE